MITIVCEEPHVLRMRESEVPVVREGEALVKVKRIGICGTDLHAYKGNQPYFTYPRTLGHELSGEIVEIHLQTTFHIGNYGKVNGKK